MCNIVTLLSKVFKNSSSFQKSSAPIKKSEGAFCNTPSLEYRNGITPLNLTMHFVSFHINGTERTRRTKVFACTTTDTTFGVDDRNLQRFRIVGILRNHLDSTCRTMAGTITTLLTISVHDTVFWYPYGMTDLDSALFFLADRLDSTSRTYKRTLVTFRSAITALVRCFRLHEV